MLSQLWEFLQEAQAQADASTRNGDAENMVERLFQDAVGRTTRPREAEPSAELLDALMRESTSSEGYAAAGDSPVVQSGLFGGQLLDESGPGSFSKSNAPIAPYETADTRRQKENEATRRLETELQKLLLGEQHRLSTQAAAADFERRSSREDKVHKRTRGEDKEEEMLQLLEIAGGGTGIEAMMAAQGLATRRGLPQLGPKLPETNVSRSWGGQGGFFQSLLGQNYAVRGEEDKVRRLADQFDLTIEELVDLLSRGEDYRPSKTADPDPPQIQALRKWIESAVARR